MALFACMTLGGYLAVADSWYQTDVGELLRTTPSVDMSCLVAQMAVNGTRAYTSLWDNTEQRLAAGDSLVLWAEEAVALDGDEQEMLLIRHAQDIVRSRRRHDGRGGMVGLAYRKALIDRPGLG
jgi:hypothetical protein